MSNAVYTWLGKCSTFGGPKDMGVKPDEGLALIQPADLKKYPDLANLFLKEQPKGTTGLARRLNPEANYVAMRWDYKETPKDLLLRSLVAVRKPGGGWHYARPVDWGPAKWTKRVIDLSPGLAKALGVKTDEVVEIRLEVAL